MVQVSCCAAGAAWAYFAAETAGQGHSQRPQSYTAVLQVGCGNKRSQRHKKLVKHCELPYVMHAILFDVQ